MPSAFSFTTGSWVLWLSRRRKVGVDKCILDTEDWVRPPWLLKSLFFKGVAKGCSRERFADAGVLLCLRPSSVLTLRGVACIGTWRLVVVTLSAFEGVPSSWRRSNRPSTCPSFCGVGPIAVFFDGVNRFRMTEGDS